MNKNIEKIAQKALEIYYNYNITANEAIEKAKEMSESEKQKNMEKAN